MYAFKSKVRYSETGSDGLLTPVMILNYFQDSSTMQSEELGVGIEYLSEYRAAWVLNFWQLDIIQRPALGQEIEILTFPYEFRGVIGRRNYQMSGLGGEVLARANAIYTLMNMEKHVPFKPDEKMLKAYTLEKCLDMEYLPRKIVFMGEGTPSDPVTVKRHDLDTNEHMNNAQYVDMALDILPDINPSRILASYHISAVKGDIIYPLIYSGDGEYGVDLRSREGDSLCRVKVINKTDSNDM